MKKYFFSLLFLLACNISLLAQYQVKGVVYDVEGIPIPGVTVRISKTNVATATNLMVPIP